MTATLCVLCSHNTTQSTIVDGNLRFCCPGCQAVYNILSAKNLLNNYQESPIFQQAVRYGLISNPALLEQLRNKKITLDECEKLYFEIEDMWCPSCAELINLVISQVPGIKSCTVDYSTDLAVIDFSPRQVSKDTLFQKIKELGYHPIQANVQQSSKVSHALTMRLCIAAFCSMNIMMFSYPLYATYFDYDGDHYGTLFAWLSMLFSLPVLFYSSFPIFRRFTNSFKVGIYGMETLVVIGVATSFLLSMYELLNGGTRVYFDSMSVIVVFVLLGKVIESKAKFSAKESLFRLNRSIPKRGRKRLADLTTHFVSIKDIAIEDTLIALAGEKIILDGVVLEGEGSCNESLMTGESFPIQKTVGSPVLSGTILQSGWLAYKVKTTAEQSTLQRIVDLIGKDIHLKAHYGHFVDYVVRWFVPFVLFVSGASVLFSYWQGDSFASIFVRGISVLLISCPCAIGIAAPLAESQLLQSLASIGVIVRNRGCLRILGKEDTFVFDKTGTITEGQFMVLSGIVEPAILGSLAAQSTHPMSLAIARACHAPLTRIESIQEYVGKGITGIYQGSKYLLGSRDFMKSSGVDVEESLQTNGIVSQVYFAKDKELLSILVLEDCLRQDAKETIQKLRPMQAILLSGDSLGPVKEIAERCGFDCWYSGCSPLEKRERIEELRNAGKTVCMLGDGINDALALTRAHVGISVLSASDISVQVSDILMTTDRLGVLAEMRKLAQKGRKVMHQNLFWAFFYNLIGMGLAFFGVLSPVFAAFAMVASSLMVLFNAKRI